MVPSAYTGEKPSEVEKHTTEADSQASTIPATEEQIATMLKESKALQTPPDRVRRMPATPQPQPVQLVRRLQSREFLRTDSAATTAAESPSPAEALDKQTHTQQTRKGQKKKQGKNQKKKTQQKKKKLAVKKSQTKTTAKKTDASKPTKKPVAAPAPAAAPHAQQPAQPDPPVPAAAPAAPPVVKTDSGKDQKDMTGSSQTPLEVKKEQKDTGSVQPVQQLAQPVTTPVAPGDTPAKSPAPESVAGLLNRQQTDQFDLDTVQKMVQEQVQAHLPSKKGGDPDPNPNPNPGDNPRIRNRDKNAHNRRMRFYRSLESFLDLTMNTAYIMKSYGSGLCFLLVTEIRNHTSWMCLSLTLYLTNTKKHHQTLDR